MALYMRTHAYALMAWYHSKHVLFWTLFIIIGDIKCNVLVTGFVSVFCKEVSAMEASSFVTGLAE
jgi:hypothetical protein